MSKEPRYYQKECVGAILKDWAHNIRALIGMATGTGKTFTLVTLMLEILTEGQRAIFIVHEEGLMYQAYEAFKEAFRDRTVGMVKGKRHQDYNADIVIAMVQSLNKTRLKKIGQVDYIMIDEAHHYVNNKWGEAPRFFLEENEHVKVVGCTATHYRADGVSLGVLFPEVAERNELTYYYATVQGIRDGYLSPFDAYTIETQLDISGFSRKGGYIGTDEQWNSLWAAGNWAELLYAEMVKAGFPDKLTMAFMPSVHISKEFAKWLGEEYRIVSSHVDGSASYIFDLDLNELVEVPRQELYDKFRKKEVQFLSNFGVTTEGFDAPLMEILVMNRPTDSAGLFMQMIGRVLRWPKEEMPNKRATILLAGFRDDQMRMADYSGIAGAIPSKEVEEVEKALEELTVEGVAQENPICPKCNQGYLSRMRGTEMYLCDFCKAMMAAPPELAIGEPLFDPAKMNGVGSYARYVNLLHSAPVAWYKENGFWCVSIGVGGHYDRTVIIAPPDTIPARPEGYSLLEIRRPVIKSEWVGYGYRRYQKHTLGSREGIFVGEPGELDDILESATQRIEKFRNPQLADKDKGWRKKLLEPDSKLWNQLEGRFGVNIPPDLTKGDASRIYAFKEAESFLKRKGVID